MQKKLMMTSTMFIVVFSSLAFGQGRGEIAVTASNAARDFYTQGLAKADALQTVDARGLFQKAVEADPNFALGHLYLGLTGGTGGMQANVKKATDLAANASEAERLFIQGYQLNTSQQPDKAIETLQQLIKVQPTAKRALVYLGTILAGRNRVDDALIHYNQALKIDPGFIPAHANRATALINKGDAAGARKDYLFVVERVPEGPTRINPLSQVALAYAYDGNTAEAGNYYEQAIALAQKANQATTVAGFCNALARIYLEHGDLINATKLYQRGYEAAMAGAPADQKPLWEARYYHARSRILAKVGEYDAAVEYVDKLQAIIDTGAEPKQHLSQIFQYLVGYIHLDRGRYDQAIGHLSRADQNDAFIQLLTARAYEGKGDAANAAVWYKKVLEYHGGGASTVLARPWAEKWVKEKAGR